MAQSVSLRGARLCPELGVKPTCRLHVQTFQFDPQETSNAEFARSKDVDNLLELIAMPWRVSKPNTTDPS
jgi:hypothetical protein